MKQLTIAILLTGTAATSAMGQQVKLPGLSDYRNFIENQVTLHPANISKSNSNDFLNDNNNNNNNNETTIVGSKMPVAVLKQDDRMPVYRSEGKYRMPVKGVHDKAGQPSGSCLSVPEPRVVLPEIKVPEAR
ncbi:hypothetical protein [Mucilaginibacter sp. SJ]|uniref:hypothetical protein n=1 Tax=Mucilaginibacter sp. SJ TaxID=3029053 RepID=UPI0023A99655|nr:hypothetical protein [Mucilaginibacter sp. SJ]WEA03865.1 hypothetical protein MusilaSJ_13065 [Mucilaginibacter sp. SJ]